VEEARGSPSAKASLGSAAAAINKTSPHHKIILFPIENLTCVFNPSAITIQLDPFNWPGRTLFPTWPGSGFILKKRAQPCQQGGGIILPRFLLNIKGGQALKEALKELKIENIRYQIENCVAHESGNLHA
jgi:hypothetical protein